MSEQAADPMVEAMAEALEAATARLTDLEAKVEELSVGQPEAGQGSVETLLYTVEVKPSIGRIVHFCIDPEGVVVRPAIITDVFEDGSVALQVFARLDDIPFAYSSALKKYDVGCVCDRAYEGVDVGQWRWPDIAHYEVPVPTDALDETD